MVIQQMDAYQMSKQLELMVFQETFVRQIVNLLRVQPIYLQELQLNPNAFSKAQQAMTKNVLWFVAQQLEKKT
jgi:hypothetical protein